jgi:Domain of unknown function (DUF4192)
MNPTRIRLGGPSDILAVLPYQLGFHPRDSLVVVSLHGSRMGLVQRIDLPPAEHAGAAVEALLAPLLREAPDGVLLLGFESAEGEALPLVSAMTKGCDEAGLAVLDQILVRDGRWFSLACADRACCPPEGRPLPRPHEVPAVAEFVGREISPMVDRTALADRLRPAPPGSGEIVAACADDWMATRRAANEGPVAGFHDVRRRELETWALVLRCRDEDGPMPELTPAQLARLAVSLTDVDIRDALVAWICPGALTLDLVPDLLRDQMMGVLPEPLRSVGDPELDPGLDPAAHSARCQRLERRLVALCAALPEAWTVPPLTVLASFTWWRGDGALTRMALERALSVDPDYRLARLLERMVDLAIRPFGVPA